MEGDISQLIGALKSKIVSTNTPVADKILPVGEKTQLVLQLMKYLDYDSGSYGESKDCTFKLN